MYLPKQRVSFFLSVAYLLLLASCGQNKASLLTRTWKINDLKYTQEVPENMQPTITNWVNEMRQSFTITYNPNGTYYTKLKDQKLEGKWKLNWNSTSITSTAHDGTVKTFHIKELTADKFEFEAEEAGEKVIFVMIPVN